MSKPRLLDLFCGSGGAGMGYYRAGFDVTGIDIVDQPRYPFPFILADALTFPLEGYDAYHASPPCQHYTQMLNWNGPDRSSYPNLIRVVRERLQATSKPYVIENVGGAQKHLIHPIMLCGLMFGLRVYRHRWFEISPEVFIFKHPHIKHRIKAAHSGKVARPDQFWCPVGKFGQKDQAQQAMGIDWMKTTGSADKEIAEAIPPAYTLWIGRQLRAYLESEALCMLK